MGASEIVLKPSQYAELNEQLLNIVVAGDSVLSSETQVISAQLVRPLLEKVRTARKVGSPILVEEEELDYFTSEQIKRIKGLKSNGNSQIKALHSTLFTLHGAWEQAGGPPRFAFQQFQKSTF